MSSVKCDEGLYPLLVVDDVDDLAELPIHLSLTGSLKVFLHLLPLTCS